MLGGLGAVPGAGSCDAFGSAGFVLPAAWGGVVGLGTKNPWQAVACQGFGAVFGDPFSVLALSRSGQGGVVEISEDGEDVVVKLIFPNLDLTIHPLDHHRFAIIQQSEISRPVA